MTDTERKPYRVTYGIPGAWTTDGDHTVEQTYELPSFERAERVADRIADLLNLVVINVEEVAQ